MASKMTDIQKLEKQYKKCMEKLDEQERQFLEADTKLDAALNQYIVTKNMEYTEKLGQLKMEHVGHIQKLKEKNREMIEKLNSKMKLMVITTYEEEVKNMTANYKEYLHNLAESIDGYKEKFRDKKEHAIALQQQIRQIEVMGSDADLQQAEKNESVKALQQELSQLKNKYELMTKRWFEKATEINKRKAVLCTELRKMFHKYKTAENAAHYYKLLLQDSKKTLIKEKEQHDQLLEIIRNETNQNDFDTSKCQ